MDLRFADAAPTDAERAAVDAVLGPPGSVWLGGVRSVADTRSASTGAAARSRRHELLPALHALHDAVGWISEGGLTYICQRLVVPPADAYGVASFYHLFSFEPVGDRVLHVCDDIACRAPAGELPAGAVASPCLGLCEVAPAAWLVDRSGADGAGGGGPIGPATPAAIEAALGRGDVAAWDHGAAVRVAGPLLARVGVVDPTSLDDYRAHGGYEALARAIELGPEGVVAAVTDSGLLGRGGATFPTGRKWAAVAAQARRPHYLICNADESEPGTFKDRVLLEGDPFAVVEAMTIAALATGCEQGYLYLRGEYPVARARVAGAIAAARQAGLLGPDVAGTGMRFDIELRLGAGAYICGEETAIFNSIEGYRGEPRNKPPFPVEVGLFGCPTVVNNVETLANVPLIVAGEWQETKLFCLSGALERRGVYEVPFGQTLGSLIEAAGPTGPVQAVLLGGAAGALVGPDRLGLELTFDAVRAAGLSLGSGVVMVFDSSADMRAVVARIARFFREESCGQCVPCRVGTVRQAEVLDRLASGATAADLVLLDDIARAMRDASICGLGQTAASAITSAVANLGLFGATDGRGGGNG